MNQNLVWILLQETNGKLSDPFIPRIRFKFSKLFFEGKIFAGAKRFSVCCYNLLLSLTLLLHGIRWSSLASVSWPACSRRKFSTESAPEFQSQLHGKSQIWKLACTCMASWQHYRHRSSSRGFLFLVEGASGEQFVGARLAPR